MRQADPSERLFEPKHFDGRLSLPQRKPQRSFGPLASLGGGNCGFHVFPRNDDQPVAISHDPVSGLQPYAAAYDRHIHAAGLVLLSGRDAYEATAASFVASMAIDSRLP